MKNLALLFTFSLVFASFGRASAYEAVPVADGAVITGEVVFKGKAPEPKKLLIMKDEGVCGEGYIERREIDVGNDGALKDVVVFLEGVKKGKAWEDPAEAYVLDQEGCAFRPYLQIIPRGTKLTILNSDPILHNIHTYELIGRVRKDLFNIAQPKFRPKVSQTVTTTRGNTIRVECDAHNWMLGWIYVVDNPYYAVVGEDGAFTLGDIPPGTYKVKAWHPFLGVKEREVSLPPRAKGQIGFEFLAK